MSTQNVGQKIYTLPKTNGWMPKMMVWKRSLPLKMAIVGIYVRFLGCNQLQFVGELSWRAIIFYSLGLSNTLKQNTRDEDIFISQKNTLNQKKAQFTHILGGNLFPQNDKHQKNPKAVFGVEHPCPTQYWALH